MNSAIRVVPQGENFEVTIDDRTFHVKPGSPMYKMAADLVRLRRLSAPRDAKFPAYTTEQLDAAVTEGRATEDMERELSRRRGVLWFPRTPTKGTIK